MKYLLIVLGLITTAYAQAASFKGIVYSENTTAPLADCNVVMMQKGKIVSVATTNFEGKFTITFKKNEKYFFEVSRVGYQTESVEFVADEDFLEANPFVEVYLKVLSIQPNFEKVTETLTPKEPNQDIMEDIGNISTLPEGYKIIEAKPLKFDDKKQSNFNVTLNQGVDNTNVNIEVLKEEFNRDDIDDQYLSDVDKFPSSYYADGDIYYGPGKALLTENVKQILNGIAQKLNNESVSILKVVAYADADKEASIGDYIAKLRVEEITKYLMSLNVNFSQLNISVMGNTNLQNECYKDIECTEFQHQENRRVDLFFAK